MDGLRVCERGYAKVVNSDITKMYGRAAHNVQNPRNKRMLMLMMLRVETTEKLESTTAFHNGVHKFW